MKSLLSEYAEARKGFVTAFERMPLNTELIMATTILLKKYDQYIEILIMYSMLENELEL